MDLVKLATRLLFESRAQPADHTSRLGQGELAAAIVQAEAMQDIAKSLRELVYHGDQQRVPPNPEVRRARFSTHTKLDEVTQ